MWKKYWSVIRKEEILKIQDVEIDTEKRSVTKAGEEESI